MNTGRLGGTIRPRAGGRNRPRVGSRADVAQTADGLGKRFAISNVPFIKPLYFFIHFPKNIKKQEK